MQTNLFNYPVMQTVIFTLIPWILDQVEDDKRGGGVTIPLPLSFLRTRESRVVGMTLLSLRSMSRIIRIRDGNPEADSYCHSYPVSGTG